MATQSPQLRRASTSAVNVRKGPSLSYEIVAGINDDNPYKVLGKYHTGQSGDIGTWWQIERPDPDVASGWVRGDNVETEGDVSGVRTTWQPYTATLRTGSLALPFKDTLAEPNVEIPPIAITNLFDDFRTRHLYTGLGGTHNGIDWAMKEKHPVYAMAPGRVTAVKPEIKEDGKVDPLGNHVIVQSSGFRITYAHLSTVAVAKGAEVIPYDPSLKDNTEPDQKKNAPLGLPGTTGNSTGVHLHAHLKPDYIADIPTGHKHVGGAVNFQQYLPAGIYHWPDIAALEAEINDASVSVRAGLVDAIEQWMDNALRGEPDPNKPRLRVTRDGAVYMIPRADARFRYPCRPFPGNAVVGKDNAVWDLPHPFAETLPTPDWWKIEINRSFPVCWVHRAHTREIGNLHKVPLASPFRPANLPRYLQKDDSTNVRSTAHTRKQDQNGELVPDGSNTILRRQGKNGNDPFWGTEGDLVLDSDGNRIRIRPRLAGWVPITKLACDATTGDYLWYEIPYDTDDSSARGWVRGDVVTIKGLLSEEEKATIPAAFAGIDPVVPESPTIAGVESKKEVVALVHDQPRDGAHQVAALEGFAEATAQVSLSPTWYQVRFGSARRGWVRAGQVTAYNTDSLNTAPPRLRRWSGHTAAGPVRRGPAAGETVRATIAADSTAWHNLLGRDAAYPGWWQIRFSNTVSGWVKADDAVEIEGNLNSAPPPRVGLADPTQACTVRTEPSSTGTELGTIAAGSTDLHPVLERDADPAAWYQIRFSDTVTGWVSAACVRLHGDGRNLPVTAPRPRASLKPSVTDGLKVRFGPGQAHAWIASIPGGSTVRYELLGKDADFPTWYQISFSDTVTGWVYKDHLLTHGSLEGLEVTWIPQLRPRTATDTTETGGLNVHAGPGAHHRVLVTLPADDTQHYDILGKDAAAAAWYQIRVGALLIGWVPREYVQTRGPLGNLPIIRTSDPNVDADPAAESGTSLNQASHHNSKYTLNFEDGTVSAVFSSTSSPVQYFARADQGRAPVFRIVDPDLRPAEKVVLSTDTAREVNRDGSTKTGGLPRILQLEVHTDGNVYYVDEGLRHIGYLDYSVAGTWTPAAAVPRERGASLNQEAHRASTYTLTVRDDTVHAVFASSSSPVQYYARPDQGRAPVFRIVDEALRPAAKIPLTVTDAQEVNQDGTPKTGGLVRTLKLEVHTDGNVYYVDEGLRHIGYLSYDAAGSWPLAATTETPTAPAPAPTPTRPTLESGTSLNQVSHRGSTYTLTRSRAEVAAVFVSTSSPVQYYARADQGRAPVFRIAAAALRPAAQVVLTTTAAQEVNRDGTTKTGGLVRTLKLEVHTDGNVYYVDEGLRRIGYLSYSIAGNWTPAAEETGTEASPPPTGTPDPAPSPQPQPTPAPARPTRERGTSLNQASHRGSTYTLNRSRNTLTAAFASTSSPVQYFARADQGRAPVFRIAAPALRPQAQVVLTTTAAREVDRDGTLRPGAADRTLKLEVQPNGDVHYADEGLRDIGYLRYTVSGSWSLAAPAPATRQLSLKATVTAGLNVRSGPGTVHGIVGAIAGGATTRYDILGKDAATAAWYQIQFSSTVAGWVHKDFVLTHGDLFGLTVTWNPPQLSLKATTTYNLNVRSGPGTSHGKVGFIPGGSATRYDILGKDAATPVWWQIRFSNTVIGWVHGNYVRTHGDVGDVPVR